MNELCDVARWGTPAAAAPLSSGVRELLGAALGITRTRPVSPVAELPSVTMSETVLKELRTACPVVSSDDADRLAHAAGKSTEDLLRLRAGQADDAPDAVARPATHQQVADLLAVCSRRHVAVVPFGGGTSVVGGLAAHRESFAGALAIDLAALDRLVRLDRVSRTATFEAGVRAPRAEELLAAEGFTLGHFPQSFEYASLGGFAATRSSGQASAGYGRFDRMVVGLRAATPVGLLETGRAPESAAGPDLRQLLLGSEGAFGVITEVTLRVRPAPQGHDYAGWSFPSFDAGTRAVRMLAQDGPLPTVLRLSDETETAINAATGGPQADGCLAVVGVEGTAEEVASRTAALAQRLTALGGTPLGAAPGEAWQAGRYRAPYQRDALLDAGAIAETLETATFWDRLPATYIAVRDALVQTFSKAGTPPLVLCHISHVYDSGASLYFTVVAAQAEDPVAQWLAAKAAAGDAIAASGATITHHHGVGRVHLPWYTREIGDVGVAALRGVKQALDPHGILNPGILLP